MIWDFCGSPYTLACSLRIIGTGTQKQNRKRSWGILQCSAYMDGGRLSFQFFRVHICATSIYVVAELSFSLRPSHISRVFHTLSKKTIYNKGLWASFILFVMYIWGLLACDSPACFDDSLSYFMCSQRIVLTHSRHKSIIKTSLSVHRGFLL